MKIFNKYKCLTATIYTCIKHEKTWIYCYRIALSYTVILVLQLKLYRKTRFHTRFNGHVISHGTHKIDE